MARELKGPPRGIIRAMHAMLMGPDHAGLFGLHAWDFRRAGPGHQDLT